MSDLFGDNIYLNLSLDGPFMGRAGGGQEGSEYLISSSDALQYPYIRKLSLILETFRNVFFP